MWPGALGEPAAVGTAALAMVACVTLVFIASKEAKMTCYDPYLNLLDDVFVDRVPTSTEYQEGGGSGRPKDRRDVRKTSDAMLSSFQNLVQSSVTRLRNELGRRDRA
jgi:hypothetical protein